MAGSIVLTRDQVRRIDELAQSQYGIPGIVLMENAGAGAARVIIELFGCKGDAIIACGMGNNGGDGMVIARHLHNAGWNVHVIIAGNAEAMSGDCAANDRIVRAMHISRTVVAGPGEAMAACEGIGKETVVVDALFGTGFRGEIREPWSSLIEQLNERDKRAMIAIDVPSGMDCDSGQVAGNSIRADHTITFVAVKPGFLIETGRELVGALHVVDIGAPRALIEMVGGEVS